MRKDRFLNIFLVGLPGSGKTKFILDSPNPLLIDFDYGDLTAQGLRKNIPILRPKNEDQIRAIIEDPELVIDRAIRKIKAFENYEVKTIAWDTISTMQDIILGEGRRPEVDFGDGVILPQRNASGILALPAARENPEMPEGKDYQVFSARMRKLALSIKQMPYHTILTAHMAPEDQVQTSTKPNPRTGAVPAPKAGYPLLTGQLRYQMGGLSDFYILLERMGSNFVLKTQPSGIFHARNRIDHLLKPVIPWKDQNGFDLLYQPLQEALQNQEENDE